MATEKQKSKAEQEDAARKRSDYIRALREERDALERSGKTARIDAVDEELKRLGEKPARRSAPRAQTAAAAGAGDPPQAPADSKA
jgi:hypothetical protein